MSKTNIFMVTSFRTIFVALLLALSATFLISSFSGNLDSAHAKTQSCSSSSKNACFNGSLNWHGTNSSTGLGKDPQPGAGGGGNGSGSASKPPSIPCVRAGLNSPYWVDGELSSYPFAKKTSTSKCHPAYKLDPAWQDGDSSECPPIKENGFTIKSVGHFVTFKAPVRFIYTRESDWYVNYVYDEFWTTCTYPKTSVASKTIECALSAKVSITRMENSAGGYKKMGLTPGSKTFANINDLTGKNLSTKCQTQASLSFSTGLNTTNQNNWGQYLLDGDIKYAICTQATLKFDGKTTYNYSCTGPHDGPATSQKMTLWCNGVETKWVMKKWTAEDCVGPITSGRSTICTPPVPTFDGKTGTVQTLRDGKQRILNWGNYKVSKNVRNVNNWKYYNTVMNGSTPWNKSVGVNEKAKQLFSSPQKFSTWAGLGSGQKQNLSFYQAANPGGSFKIQRSQKFDAEFKVKVSNFKSFNPFTGKVTTTTTSKWVKGNGILCPTQTSPNIQPIRTIGDVDFH